MEFKKFTLGGKIYPDEVRSLKENDDGTYDFLEDIEEDDLEERQKFFLFMALCHNMTVDKNGKNVKYESQSPDEQALVKAAANAGIVLNDVTKHTYEIDNEGNDESYEVFHEFEFKSSRARQSVVLRDPQGKLWIMTKGADSVMMDLINWESGVQKTIDE